MTADEPFNFITEPDWTGHFTRQQAEGAIPNGSTIRKAKQEAGDGTPLGTHGLVIGSFSHPEVHDGLRVYFVEWANRPRMAVAIVEWKIEAVTQETPNER
jgi:hypothetical protein